MMDIPGCYGEFWEAIPGSACVGCFVKDDCLAKFVTGTLVRYQQKLGARATPEALAEESGVKMEAICVALQFQANIGMGQAGKAEPEPEPEDEVSDVVRPPPAPPPIEGGISQDIPVPLPVSSGEMPEEASEKPPEVIVPKKDKAPAKKATSKKLPVEKADKKSADKKAPAKKAPAKKVASKKSTSKKAATPASHPSKAGSAKPARDPARSEDKSARLVSAPAGTREWGEKHHDARWRRERKHPLIAKLKPGMRLQREWAGEIHRVMVKKGGYRYRGQDYPTLYSVTKAVVGTRPSPKQFLDDGTRPKGTRELVAWSGLRFWRLQVYLESKGLLKSVAPKRRPGRLRA